MSSTECKKHPGEFEDECYFCLEKEVLNLRDKLDKAVKQLEGISEILQEEIDARCAGLLESKVRNLKTLTLLRMPKNMVDKVLSYLRTDRNE